jgi:RNA polymerase sigma factor (sigma-70 family)
MDTVRPASRTSATAIMELQRAVVDQDLIQRVRSGDRSAEQVLYRLYLQPALRRARQLGAQSADADDYVAEAFLRVIRQLRLGRGPNRLFAPYLFAALRNLAADAGRGQRGRELPTDQIGVTIDPRSTRTAPDDEVVTRVAVQAAMSELPQRWREVLWRMHVEGQSPSALADELGGTAKSMSAVAFRARRALRDAYEQSA